MEYEEIKDAVFEDIRRAIGKDRNFGLDTNVVEILDSVDIAEVLLDLEVGLGIDIPLEDEIFLYPPILRVGTGMFGEVVEHEEIDKTKYGTVRQLVDYVKRKVEEKEAA